MALLNHCIGFKWREQEAWLSWTLLTGLEPGLWLRFPGRSSIPLLLQERPQVQHQEYHPQTDPCVHTERLRTKKGRVINNLPSETGREAGCGAQLKAKLGSPLRMEWTGRMTWREVGAGSTGSRTQKGRQFDVGFLVITSVGWWNTWALYDTGYFTHYDNVFHEQRTVLVLFKLKMSSLGTDIGILGIFTD